MLLTLVFANQAFAHATPITYEPEASAVIEKAPERIQIHFSERIEPKASSITVFGPDGSRVDDTSPRVDANDPHFFSIGIKDTGEGTYTVSWQVVSADDGHFTKGAFVFSVGIETATAPAQDQFQIVHFSTVPEGITLWIELLGQAILIAGLLLLALLWRPLREKYGLDDLAFRKRFLYTLVCGALFVVIGTVAYIILKTIDLQQLQSSNFNSAFQNFISTVAGKYALYRAILVAGFLTIFLFFRKKIFEAKHITTSEIVLWMVILLIACARARVSHAAASHFHPNFSVFVNLVHLMFKATWVGGLIMSAFVFLPVVRKAKTLLSFADFSTSFSKVISIAFGLAGVSGAYIVWLHLKDPANIFTTDWGARFVTLSVVGGILFALRLYQQFFTDKSAVMIARGSPDARANKHFGRIHYIFPLEVLVGVLLLFVTSFMIITTPPLSHTSGFEKTTESQDARIILSEYPSEADQFLVTVESKSAIKDLVITATNEEKSIGPVVVENEKRFESGYIFPKTTLSPPGNWKLDISVQRKDTYDAVASFAINYPAELGTSNEDKRTFDFFTLQSILAAIGIAIFALFLYRYSRKLREQIIGVNESKAEILSIKPAWAIAFPVFVLITLFLWFSYINVLRSEFQRQCVKDGNFWHTMVPIRNGKVVSQNPVAGCMTADGRFHFGDHREYAYFMTPVEPLVDMAVESIAEVGRPINLIFTIKDKDGNPIRDLTIEHERILHAIFIGEDLEEFAHVHAEDLGVITADMKKETKYPVRFTPRKAGKYLVAVDFAVKAQHFSKQFTLDVSGAQKMSPAAPDFARIKTFDGYEVALSVPSYLTVGKMETLTFRVNKDSKPVTDLVPYLGAAMHIAVVKDDFNKFLHVHGEVHLPGQTIPKNPSTHYHLAPPKQFGPNVEGHIVFPEKGIYYVFGELKHSEEILRTIFVVQVD